MNLAKKISFAFRALKIGFNNPQPGRRAYDAGKVGRFVTDWMNLSSNINYDIRNSKENVDRRVADLSKNNPYARGYIESSKVNVVGYDGFTFHAMSEFPNGEYDDFANDIIEAGFKKWCRRQYCTMTKRFSFLRVQWLVLVQLCVTGEFLVRKITKINSKQNPFGFSLELLDTNDIDINYNDELPGGNIVLMGVEFNEWKEIKAIWLKKRLPKEELIYSDSYYYSKRERVSMDELYYDFDPDHPKQSRGMTPLSAVVLSLKGIDRWEDYSLINAAASAAKMGFLEDVIPTAAPYTGSKRNSTTNDEDKEFDGGKYMDVEAGIIEELPYGKKFTGFDPKFPHEQHPHFVKAMLRKISTAIRMAYNTFSNDLEGVNFSSMRSGLQEERDNWKLRQSFFRESFLIPLYEDWLKWALNSGALQPLAPANYEKYLSHYWQGRRWPWVDPTKDVIAAEKSERNGYASKIDIVSEKGGNIEDVFRDRQLVKKLAKKYDCPELVEFSDSKTPAPPEYDEDETAEEKNRKLSLVG